jgi:tRNA A-37 threonylcarbamoyl transferase component Bud32
MSDQIGVSFAAATAGLPAALAEDLRIALNGPARRVQRLARRGHGFWLKRPEHPRSLRWRLQKGDPLRAFQAERDGLEQLARLGAPVPRLVLSGPDFMLLEDAGPTLSHLLDDPGTPESVAKAAIGAAGTALGRLHARGLAHGRPYLRDICWDGAQIRMIDFERFSQRNGAGRQGRDAVLFLSSLLQTPRGEALFDTALAAWRAEAPEAATRAATRWVWCLRLLAPTARAIARLRAKQSEIAGFLALTRRWP